MNRRSIAVIGALGALSLALAGCSTTSADGSTDDVSEFNWQTAVTNVAFDGNNGDGTNVSNGWAITTTAGSGSGQCSSSSTATSCQFTQAFTPSGSAIAAQSASTRTYASGPITLNLSDGSSVTLANCSSWEGIEGAVSCSN